MVAIAIGVGGEVGIYDDEAGEDDAGLEGFDGECIHGMAHDGARVAARESTGNGKLENGWTGAQIERKDRNTSQAAMMWTSTSPVGPISSGVVFVGMVMA